MLFNCVGAKCYGYASLADGRMVRWDVEDEDDECPDLVTLNRCVAHVPVCVTV